MPSNQMCQTVRCRRLARNVVFAEANPYSGTIKVCNDQGCRRIARNAFTGKTEMKSLAEFLDDHFPRPERSGVRDHSVGVMFEVKVFGTEEHVTQAAQKMAQRLFPEFDIFEAEIIDEEGNIEYVDISEARRLVRG